MSNQEWEIAEVGECVNFPLYECRVTKVDPGGNKIEGSCLIEDPDGAQIWGPVYDMDRDFKEMHQERRTSLEIAEKNIKSCEQLIGFAGTRRPMTQNNVDFLKALLRDSLERIARVKNE